MPDISKLSFYSVAVVAKNKPLSTRDIEATPIENLNMVNGEITSLPNEYKASAADSQGQAYQVNMQTTNTVKATWLPINGSNRITAPDVRRGETVVLYRFADTDQFWWSTLKDDMDLRRLETVIYAWSATTDESQKVNPEHYYFLEISTHRKMVHFHTTDKNGEPFKYDVQINTDKGFITIKDDEGNSILLDSAERHLQMINKDGSVVDINKKNIIIRSTDNIVLESKNITTKSVNLTDNTSIYKMTRSSADIS